MMETFPIRKQGRNNARQEEEGDRKRVRKGSHKKETKEERH